ncbi:ThuA domain-containing protein, partial [Pengzhenrongella sp.]|uniref:ThuA domain-containing protein n=1 Tax=Pengzhenrongella sp. TaxID=2888820 RepID=UPI002F92CFE9
MAAVPAMSQPRRALVVRGGWAGHSPRECTEAHLGYLRAAGFAVEIAESLEVYADADFLAGFDLIVQCWSMGTLTPEQERGLVDAVQAGTGFAGWHGGIIATFATNARYLRMVGGRFVWHADGFVRHSVQVGGTAPDHPIVAGLTDFRVETEQYWLLSDPLNDVLATTTIPADDGDPWPEPVTMPVTWTRRWGDGRVFVCTLGHQLSDFDVPQTRTMIERGMSWAAR